MSSVAAGLLSRRETCGNMGEAHSPIATPRFRSGHFKDLSLQPREQSGSGALGLASLVFIRGAASAPRRRLSSQSASRRNFPDRHGPDAHRGCLRSARRVSPQPSTQAFVLPAAGRRPVGTPSETWEPNPCREVAAALPAPGPEPVPARAMGQIMGEARKVWK